MASTRLSNYLRTHRKRLGLSQKEVAHLLGAAGGAKVCRYERFNRIPSLETALACEVVFKKPVRELFAGLYQQAERNVASKATVLLQRQSGPNDARKQKLLHEMTVSSRKSKKQKSE